MTHWRDAPVRAVVSVFFIGYSPLAPGTLGSLAGAAFAWFWWGNPFWAAAFLSVLGLALCRPAQEVFGVKDPSPFVLDEACGMQVALLGIPKNIVLFAAAFVLFRALDICKPGWISKAESYPHPFSIMADDLLAGFFVNLVLQSAMVCRNGMG